MSKFLLLLPLLLIGCGGSGDEVSTATVTGEVKKGAAPADNVMVVFYPASGPSAIARTDDSGHFSAEVPVGECKVAVMAASESSADTSPAALQAQAKAKPVIDVRYSNPGTSGLTVNVQPDENENVVFTVE